MIIEISGKIFYYMGMILTVVCMAFIPLPVLIISSMIIMLVGLIMIIFNQYLEIDTRKEE